MLTRYRLCVLSIATVATLAFSACAPAAPPAEPAPPPAEPAPAAPAPAPEPKPAAPEAKPAEPKPEPDYFEGRTITLLVGSSPGGGTDTIVRTVGRHLGRFIPGNPTVIAQNMPGAGGMTALNHMVTSTAPDGLTFNGSISQTLIFAQLEGRDEVRYDLTELTWVGTAIDDAQVLWLRSETPYTDIEAIRQADTAPRLGAQSGTHPSVVNPRIASEVTGLEFNVITGYPGSPEIFLDVERGALDGRFASYGSLQTQRPEWLEEEFVRILLFTGQERHPDLPDVPTIFELIPPEREALSALITGPQSANRSMAGPPGIPPEVAQIVQDAYAEMARDPEFVAEMQATGFDTGLTGPETIREALTALMADEELRTTLIRLLEAE